MCGEEGGHLVESEVLGALQSKLSKLSLQADEVKECF